MFEQQIGYGQANKYRKYNVLNLIAYLGTFISQTCSSVSQNKPCEMSC